MTTIKIGMLGFGTVGSGVVERLTQAAAKIEQTHGLHLELTTVAVHHLHAPRQAKLPAGTRLTTVLTDVVSDPQIQLVIEVMGTVTTAKQAITTALEHGKSVITANKDLIATAGQDLIDLAHRNRCDLFYEASVAGGIPILRTLTDSYATDTIQAVTGILNGTANYILSAMTQTGQTYPRALAAAQAAGYAESDPTNDVGGLDTTYKLMILTRLAFGQQVTQAQIAPRGITTLTADQCQAAAKSGWTIKLLAQAQRQAHHLYCRVAPVALDSTHALSRIDGVQNGVAIQSQAIGESLYAGPGAGSTATGNSVLNDVLVAAQRFREGTRGTAITGVTTDPLPVINLAALPQEYLLFSDLPGDILFRWATDGQFTIQPLPDGGYRTSRLTAEQCQALQASDSIQLVPIAGTVAWPVAVKS